MKNAMFPTTNLFSPSLTQLRIETGLPIISTGMKVATGVFLVGYVFFALFLYLRVRILSLTLTTPNSGIMRYVSLLHFFAVLALALFLGLLLLF
ncbi:hypothetical protein IT418_01090 [bacterium]|nr:hypothetical protein [bacterium]